MKIRRTLQSDPEFIKELRKIQGKIKAENGNEPSLTDLTKEIVRVPAFREVEQQILRNENAVANPFKIKLDKKIK